MSAKTKDVTIRGTEYQIGKLDARTGSYIALTIMTKVLPSFLSEDKLKLGELPKNRVDMTESEFHVIQGHCLAVCRRYTAQRLAEQVMTTDGRFVFPDMADDIPTVLGLTIHALMFSVAPFFEDGGLASVMSLVPDLNPPKVPAA